MNSTLYNSSRQHGLSLVELMVAITIGLVLTAAMGTLIVNTSASHAELAKLNRQIENGRYAYETVADDLRHAGNYGMYNPTKQAVDSPPDACTTDAATLLNSLPYAVQGISNYAASGAASDLRTNLYSCLPSSAIVAGTDVLALRRASTESSTVSIAGAVSPALLANQHYLQVGLKSDTSIGAVLGTATSGTVLTTFTMKKKDAGTGTSSGNPATYNTPADLRLFVVHIYFVSPCSEEVLDCTGKAQLPTLKRLELGSGPAMGNVMSIAEGIEQFQVDYGVDVDGTGSVGNFYQCISASGMPVTYETGCKWQDVVAARISILARNSERSSGYTDDRTYNLGLWGVTTATSDNYKRHVFSGVVKVNNVGMTRECMPTSLEPC